MRSEDAANRRRLPKRAMAFAAVSSTIVLIVVLALYLKFTARLGGGVTREGLLAVHPGMPSGELVTLIGEPILKRSDVWIYGMPGIRGNGLEIYVGMSNGRVSEIGVEDHDLGVYAYRENMKPELWKPNLLNQLPHKRD